jgi:hypothetical protein
MHEKLCNNSGESKCTASNIDKERPSLETPEANTELSG